MKTRRVRLLSLLPMLFLFVIVLAGCGQGTTAPNEVSMSAGDFSATSITIKVGQTVHFTDPVGTGGMHTICLGKDGTCNEVANGPQALQSPGFTMDSGDAAKDVTFDKPGTYLVTCSIHPAMNLTVIVQ